MSDYYSILGVSKTASAIEIKSAFRKLVKIYHPDKNPNNPNSKKIFEDILKAYNTLINPNSRKRYDTLKEQGKTVTKSHPNQARQRGQKEWSVNDEELKRRDYYKKQYQHATRTSKAAFSKQTYNDYKYILFAMPIAVALLMLIITIFNSEPETKFNDVAKSQKKTLQIHNISKYDALVILFDKNTNSYSSQAYIKNSDAFDLTLLSRTEQYFKCVLGRNNSGNKVEFTKNQIKGFDSIVQYQNYKTQPLEFNNESVTKVHISFIEEDGSPNKKYISNELDFFEK
jgi:curved DNA-binding protein CbpA